jgi:hypothetical protein
MPLGGCLSMEIDKVCDDGDTGLLKQSYSAPILMNYGSLSEITQQSTEKPYFGNDGNTQCTGNANAATTLCAAS